MTQTWLPALHERRCCQMACGLELVQAARCRRSFRCSAVVVPAQMASRAESAGGPGSGQALRGTNWNLWRLLPAVPLSSRVGRLDPLHLLDGVDRSGVQRTFRTIRRVSHHFPRRKRILTGHCGHGGTVLLARRRFSRSRFREEPCFGYYAVVMPEGLRDVEVPQGLQKHVLQIP